VVVRTGTKKNNREKGHAEGGKGSSKIVIVVPMSELLKLRARRRAVKYLGRGI